jgi:hypothetical protein
MHVACGGADNSAGGNASYSGVDSCANDVPWTGPVPADTLDGGGAASLAASAVAACALTLGAPVLDLDCGPLLAIAGLAGVLAFCSAITSDSNSNINFGKAQPQALSGAEEQALADKSAGRPYDHAAYNSAMQKVKYNEKVAGNRHSSR